MVIVDSTVWIDLLAGRSNAETDWLARELVQQRMGLTDLILCEVLQGIRGESAFMQVREQLLEFEVFDSGGAELAVAAARNYRLLREQGLTVRTTIDCLIATFCLENGHTLLHRDRDFDVFEKRLGLRVVRP
jgi:predicted nucleic acid-binding protein